MAALAQAAQHLVGKTLLYLQLLAQRPHPWRFHRLLCAHAVIDDIDDGLQRRGEDAHSTHEAHAEERLAIFFDDDGRHAARHALAGGDGIGHAGMRVEDVHGVVQQHAGAGHRRLGTEGRVDGVGGGNDVALRVRRRHVRGGVRLRQSARIACLHLARRLHADFGTATCRIVLVHQHRYGHVDERGVSHVAPPILEADADYLGKQVYAVHGSEAQPRHIEPFQDVQHFDHVDAASGGRRRPDDVETSIAALHHGRWHGAIVPQIAHRHDAAVGLNVVHGPLAERTAVERIRAGTGNPPQRLCVFALANEVARP